MKTSRLFTLAVLGGFLLTTSPLLNAQTDVRREPGGKRLFFVDGDDIRTEPGGKRLLFVDGDDIRPEPGGKRLLMVDSDRDVRHTPGGIRLAVWDGPTLRRTPGGEILLFVDGDDIRTDNGGERLWFLDGPELNHAQLTAVLSLLKPDLFTLSAEDTAEKQKEMADNGAAAEVAAGVDPWIGDHKIAGQNTAETTKRTGSIEIKKRADYYEITYKTGETPVWKGIGVAAKPEGGDPELWAAVGPAGQVALGVYKIEGGKLMGTWFPVNAAGDKSVLGFENLDGGAALNGLYQILSGKLPNGGAAYKGALKIDPLPVTFGSAEKAYRIRWSTGMTAEGFRLGDHLVVAAGWGADSEILRIRFSPASLSVDLLNKAGKPGDYTLLR